MAPEVLERPHNEKTDSWSVGCIALELATCNHTDLSEVAGKSVYCEREIDKNK